MRIPDTMLIPTCASCDETFMGPEDSKRVDAALDQVFRREQRGAVAKGESEKEVRNHQKVQV